MKLGKDLDRKFAYASNQLRPTLHLNEDCPPLRNATTVHTVATEAHEWAQVCKVCDPDHHVVSGATGLHRQCCRECGATLDDCGNCEFCDRFDAVMAD